MVPLCGRRRFIQQRLQGRFKILARSLADKLLTNAPSAINQVGHRQTGAVAKLRADFFGAPDYGVVLPHVFLKTANGFSGVYRRDRCAHNRKTARLQIPLQRQRRAEKSSPARPRLKR